MALGNSPWRIIRARALGQAVATAVEKGDEDPQGRAAVEVVKALTGDEPWYRQFLGRKSDGG